MMKRTMISPARQSTRDSQIITLRVTLANWTNYSKAVKTKKTNSSVLIPPR